MLPQWSPGAAAGLSWSLSTSTPPWQPLTSEELVMCVHSGVSDLSSHTALQSHCSQNMGWERDRRHPVHFPTMCQLEMVKGIRFLTSHFPENPIPFRLWPQVSWWNRLLWSSNGLHVSDLMDQSQFSSSQTLHSDSPNWLLHPWPYSASVTFFQSFPPLFPFAWASSSHSSEL